MAINGPPPFTLRQLQYAVAVAETLSFRKAAACCHVSQPALSAQLAQLEDALGVRLFERDRRRVLATPAGTELVDRARRVLQEAGDLAEAAAGAGDPLGRELRVGVIPTISPYLLPAIAPALRRAFPRLALRWTEDRTAALVRSLDAGALDAALVAREADLGDLEQEVVSIDPFVLATPPGHPLGAREEPATTADLAQADVLLLDEGHCLREQALALCSRARAHELAFRATSLPTLVQMVAGGAGVTLLPQLAVTTEAARSAVRVRPFRAPAPHRTIVLAWRRRSPVGPALRTLAETIRGAYPAAAEPPRVTSRAGVRRTPDRPRARRGGARRRQRRRHPPRGGRAAVERRTSKRPSRAGRACARSVTRATPRCRWPHRPCSRSTRASRSSSRSPPPAASSPTVERRREPAGVDHALAGWRALGGGRRVGQLPDHGLRDRPGGRAGLRVDRSLGAPPRGTGSGEGLAPRGRSGVTVPGWSHGSWRPAAVRGPHRRGPAGRHHLPGPRREGLSSRACPWNRAGSRCR